MISYYALRLYSYILLFDCFHYSENYNCYAIVYMMLIVPQHSLINPM